MRDALSRPESPTNLDCGRRRARFHPAALPIRHNRRHQLSRRESTLEEYCLGFEALGRCSASAAPLLSLGEALAVAVLLFALYRLSNRIVEMRLRTRGLTQRALSIAIGASLAMAAIAAVLRTFGPPWSRVPVIGFPLAWEIGAALVLGASAVQFGLFALRPSRLKPGNATEFVAGVDRIIASGDPEALRQLGNEIEATVPIVAKHCRDYRDRSVREGPIEADAYTRACFALLDAWSEPRFCNAIVCWCPGTAAEIVKALTQHAVHGDGAALGSELVNQAFCDERSLLYAEARISGLRRQRVFLKSIFGEWDLLDSAVRPLASWRVFADAALSERKVQRWSEAVETAFGTFVENGKHGEAVFRFRQGLETLNQICADILAERATRGAPWASVHDQLFEIACAYRTIVKRIRTSNLPVPVETTVANYDPLTDETLHGAIAEELFHFFGALTESADHEFLDWITMGPWKELFEEGELTNNLRALQVRVAYHLTVKIDDNLVPDRRFAPPITRLLLVRYPLAAIEENPKAVVAKDLEEYLLASFQDHFPALWQSHREYAQRLLPDNVDYDEGESLLRIRHPRRDTVELPLGPHVDQVAPRKERA